MKFDVDRGCTHTLSHTKGTKHPWAARKMADAMAQRGVFEAHRETDHEPGTWSSSAQRHAWPEKKLQLRWCRSQTSTSLRTDGAMWTSLETKARRSPSAELKVPWQNLPGAPPKGPWGREPTCAHPHSPNELLREHHCNDERKRGHFTKYILPSDFLEWMRHVTRWIFGNVLRLRFLAWENLFGRSGVCGYWVPSRIPK